MLYLFDLDDTLLDHSGADRQAVLALHKTYASAKPLAPFLTAWQAAQDKHYKRYTDGAITFQDQRRARLRDVIDPNLDDAQADQIFAFYLACYESNWSVFADVWPCLDRLAAHRIGLVTNGDGQQQRRKLSQTGLMGRFDPLVISSECGFSKPDARTFRLACDLAEVEPCDALYIGDSYEIDYQSARRAGLQALWLWRPPARPQTDRRPDLRTLADLHV